jgi:hypothetical protein
MVEVLLRVVVLPFGVDVNTEVSVENDVMTWEMVFGVIVAIWMSETIIVSTRVTGTGVMVVDPVTFDVVSLVVVEDGP